MSEESYNEYIKEIKEASEEHTGKKVTEMSLEEKIAELSLSMLGMFKGAVEFKDKYGCKYCHKSILPALYAFDFWFKNETSDTFKKLIGELKKQ